MQRDIRTTLKGQYRAGLLMLRECVAKCPPDLWVDGSHPRHTWRIAYHTIFYTHYYLSESAGAFQKWQKCPKSHGDLWGDPAAIEPYSKEQILGYIDFVLANQDRFVDAMDLHASDCGFPYYPNTPKLDHQLINLRHLQGHVGQLSELLMARGIETDWLGTRL